MMYSLKISFHGVAHFLVWIGEIFLSIPDTTHTFVFLIKVMMNHKNLILNVQT